MINLLDIHATLYSVTKDIPLLYVRTFTIIIFKKFEYFLYFKV